MGGEGCTHTFELQCPTSTVLRRKRQSLPEVCRRHIETVKRTRDCGPDTESTVVTLQADRLHM